MVTEEDTFKKLKRKPMGEQLIDIVYGDITPYRSNTIKEKVENIIKEGWTVRDFYREYASFLGPFIAIDEDYLDAALKIESYLTK